MCVARALPFVVRERSTSWVVVLSRNGVVGGDVSSVWCTLFEEELMMCAKAQCVAFVWFEVPSPKIIFSPTVIFRPGRTRVSQVSGESWRTSRTSIGACRCSWRAGLWMPGGSAWMPTRRPKRRAGKTRALLRTISSSPRSSSGNSRNWRSSHAPVVLSRSSMREASRVASGCCAMRSGGRSKFSSSRFILARAGIIVTNWWANPRTSGGKRGGRFGRNQHEGSRAAARGASVGVSQ